MLDTQHLLLVCHVQASSVAPKAPPQLLLWSNSVPGCLSKRLDFVMASDSCEWRLSGPLKIPGAGGRLLVILPTLFLLPVLGSLAFPLGASY